MSTAHRMLARLATLTGSQASSPSRRGRFRSPAQYFGRNKVQYRTFDFRVLKTPHFDIYFYPEEEAAARDAARMAERWYARLSRILDHEFEAAAAGDPLRQPPGTSSRPPR